MPAAVALALALVALQPQGLAGRRVARVRPARAGLVLDVGGEGAHRGAINVNPSAVTTTTGEPGRPIPNRVKGKGEAIPFRAGSAARIYLENAPIQRGAAAELARVIRPGGRILLVHPADYAAKHHGEVIRAVGGRARSQTRDGFTRTLIVAPTRGPPRARLSVRSRR